MSEKKNVETPVSITDSGDVGVNKTQFLELVDSMEGYDTLITDNGLKITKIPQEDLKEYDYNGKGSYRMYFHLGKVGIKFADFRFKKGRQNNLCRFLAAVIMNILEYKRSRIYPIDSQENYQLAKVYFTCGLFNIVEHLEVCKNIFIPEDSVYCSFELESGKPSNLGLDEKGNLKFLDFGDFQLKGYNSHNVNYIAYDYPYSKEKFWMKL